MKCRVCGYDKDLIEWEIDGEVRHVCSDIGECFERYRQQIIGRERFVPPSIFERHQILREKLKE